MFNIKLAYHVLDYLKANPEDYDQSNWFNYVPECGTSACIAGWIVLLGDSSLADKIYNISHDIVEHDLDSVDTYSLSHFKDFYIDWVDLAIKLLNVKDDDLETIEQLYRIFNGVSDSMLDDFENLVNIKSMEVSDD